MDLDDNNNPEQNLDNPTMDTDKDETSNGSDNDVLNSTGLLDLLVELENGMYPNGGEIHASRPQCTNLVNNTPNFPSSTIPNAHSTTDSSRAVRNQLQRNVTVQITEQPAPKALRFRYECEGRSAGSIPGVSSSPENKTFPSIRVHGYQGRAVVVVSCVTKDQPYRPHPHNLVGRDGCKKGVCTVEINSETMSVTFSNLGIQCVKKKDIDSALRTREEIRVDPYRTGFSHRSQPSSIDLNAVRLCFQVFLEGEQKGKLTVPLQPVVSDPIFDKKAMSDLVICKLSDCTSSVAGGKDIILLCEKVAKEDISVRFFEEHNDVCVWEAYGDFQHTNVHKQVAISFRTPAYRTLDVNQPVKILIQLKRPSDGVVSDALPFELLPLDAETGFKRKRQKYGNSEIFRQLQGQEDRNNQHRTFLNVSTADQVIKTEPRDTTPSPYNLYGGRMMSHSSPSSDTPSPSPSMHSPYAVGPNEQSNLFSVINQEQQHQQMQPQYGESSLNPNFATANYSNFHPINSHLPHYSQTPQWNLSPSPNILQHALQQQPQQTSPNGGAQQPPMNNLNSSTYNVTNLAQPVANATNVKATSVETQQTASSSNIVDNLLMDMQPDNTNSLSNVSLSLFNNAEQQLTTSFIQLSTGTINDYNL